MVEILVIINKLFTETETVALSTATGYSTFASLDNMVGIGYQVVQTASGGASSVVTLQFSDDGTNWDDEADSALTLTNNQSGSVSYDHPHHRHARIKIEATGAVSCAVTRQRRGA